MRLKIQKPEINSEEQRRFFSSLDIDFNRTISFSDLPECDRTEIPDGFDDGNSHMLMILVHTRIALWMFTPKALRKAFRTGKFSRTQRRDMLIASMTDSQMRSGIAANCAAEEMIMLSLDLAHMTQRWGHVHANSDSILHRIKQLVEDTKRSHDWSKIPEQAGTNDAQAA